MHKFYAYERKLMVVDFFQMDRSSVPLVDFCLRRIIILLKKKFDLHSRAKSHVKISFFVLVTLRSIYIYKSILDHLINLFTRTRLCNFVF